MGYDYQSLKTDDVDIDFNIKNKNFKLILEKINGKKLLCDGFVLCKLQFLSIYIDGTANVYTVNKHLSWNSWGTNYKSAKFDVKIVLSQSE